MDKSRMQQIIHEAAAKVVALDDALEKCNQEVASWTLLLLSGIIEDLQRLSAQEPMPAEMDREKLLAALQTAVNAITEGGESVRTGEYSLARSDSVLLALALEDIVDIINKMPGN